jgi:formamidopyrimidine-DNA glycosylase
LGILGPDPLSKGFDAKKLREQLMRRGKWPIKSALLDQSILAGIGNIYSDEILWKIGVHPLSVTGQIPEKKFGEMFKVMQKILLFSIKHGGDSKSDYRNAFGEKGGFQNFHQVYGRRKEKCLETKCKKNKQSIIERIVVRGRSSHFCPIHQRIY